MHVVWHSERWCLRLQMAANKHRGTELATLQSIVQQAPSGPRYAAYHAAYADALWAHSSMGPR